MHTKLFLILLLFTVKGSAQRIVTYPSLDGLLVTADLYLEDKDFPYILLFHQANSSRGEYNETAPKLAKMGYNCLAIDLRSGKEMNYIQNLTAARAAENKLPNSYLDAEQDIIASIAYVKSQSVKPIILFGSSYSASLVMKVGNHLPEVSAIIAFSPGEYFQPKIVLKSFLENFDKPLFVSSTLKENTFVKELVSEVSHNMLTLYTPTQGEGVHGSKALWENQKQSNETWLSLMVFFKNLKLE
jgi:predicted alpha/beta hydrolase